MKHLLLVPLSFKSQGNAAHETLDVQTSNTVLDLKLNGDDTRLFGLKVMAKHDRSLIAVQLLQWVRCAQAWAVTAWYLGSPNHDHPRPNHVHLTSLLYTMPNRTDLPA